MGARPEHATEHDLTITRTFGAHREAVFAAWIEPGKVMRWMAPRGFTIPSAAGDPRPGGVWGMTMHPPRGDDLRLRGTYREVRPPESLVFTHAWLEEDGTSGAETVITATFVPEGSGTKMTFHQAGFDSVDERDGHRDGWNECFDRLEELLVGSG